jgi:uncharacterized protein YraI
MAKNHRKCVVRLSKNLIDLMKGEHLMKSLIPAIILIAVLVACSNAAPITVTPTATVPPTQTEPAIATATEPPVPTQTATPVPTATQTPAPTPPNGVQACVLPYRLTVRSGPGTTYDIAGALKKGACVYVIARNPNNTWFWEISNDVNGWIDGVYLSPQGNLSSLPLMTIITQTPGAVFQNPAPSATVQP